MKKTIRLTIDGREVECAVIGNNEPFASVLGEIIPDKEFYDYEAKYVNAESYTIIPAKLEESVSDKIKEYAIKAFEVLDLKGLSRIDFFIDKDTDEIYLNEVNTIPGFTNISMYPKLFIANGVDYNNLVSKLLELAVI